MKIESQVITYILRFLCPDPNWNIEENFAYCRADELPPDKKIVIVRSDFFNDDVYRTERSLPKLPLAYWDDVPLLFGSGQVEIREGQIILYADLIASTFFLITRYEELVRPDVRDKNGRFPGTESLPYRAGFLNRPIVEEYGRLLRRIIRESGLTVAEPEPGFTQVWLTHDVDNPWEPFTPMSAAKRVLGSLLKRHRVELYPIFNCLGNPTRDPVYRFADMMQIDRTAKGAQSVYFVLSGGTSKPQDRTVYIHSSACKRLLKSLTDSGAILGYHASYTAGQDSKIVGQEIAVLNSALGKTARLSRNHYLCSREPVDFHALISAGITDDFTMGYADVAGFRLGTCRPVKWIDPISGDLTDLTLHPLTVMECTLDSSAYMAIPTLNEAFRYCQQLLDSIFSCAGEVVLLWHNTSFARRAGYQRELYERLISYINEKTKSHLNCR